MHEQPLPPTCIAKALAAYWRIQGDLPGHRVDKWDKLMASRIWDEMLKQGYVATLCKDCNELVGSRGEKHAFVMMLEK